MSHATLILTVILSSFGAALWTLWMMRHNDADMKTKGSCVFLIENDQIIDTTAPAAALLAALPGEGEDFLRLTRHLSARFGDLSGLDEMEHQGILRFQGADGALLLAEDVGGGTLRLRLEQPEDEGGAICRLSQQAQQVELNELREAVDRAPALLWREDATGTITWANAAYMATAENHFPQSPPWPLPRLFERSLQEDASPRRARLSHQGEGQNPKEEWFDYHSLHSHDGRLCFALPADVAVKAERSLREFVQTLTKTFADLPIGMAIFDRHRNLQLFNPALIDLTGLPTGFLTARPSLYTFLDRLREARMVPEPKDYRSWREQMANLEAEAARGYHVRTWSLPGGQTYRVTGRPHPDGAVAFLFEDITSEITLTRKFSADLALSARALDAIEDAVIVFAANGEVQIANESYRQIWQHEPQFLSALLDDWGKGQSGPGWERLRSLLTTTGSREQGEGMMRGPDGAMLRWRLRPMPRGDRMVSFIPAIEATSSQTLPAAVKELALPPYPERATA